MIRLLRLIATTTRAAATTRRATAAAGGALLAATCVRTTLLRLERAIRPFLQLVSIRRRRGFKDRHCAARDRFA